jgi:hypothetical protein
MRVCHRLVHAAINRNYTEQSECSSRKSSPSLDRCRTDDTETQQNKLIAITAV